MSESILIQLAGILIAGILAQWVAWHLEVPAILTLLVCGILLGPVLNLVDPDTLFGPILFPFVSFAVALILFEGGLNLKFKELYGIGNIFYRLISIGVLIAFLVAMLAGLTTLHLSIQTSAMLGAILVVTGPTVIIPILRQVHLKASLNSILKWEGIFIDPLGAVFAVMVYEVIQLTQIRDATPVIVFAVIKTILAGGCVGFSAASLLVGLMYKQRLPDFLHIPVTLMIVITAFVVSNFIQAESGLLATTVMGVVLANQKWVSIKHILEFKENLGVLLISLLFIVLAARLEFEEFFKIGWDGLLFLGGIIFIARPFATILSTVGSKLNWRERCFIAWMAPRGIVAAAVAVIFQERMLSLGIADADRIAPLVFLVIIVTVVVYGFSALPLAKRLGLTLGTPNGVLIVGAHSWARSIALALREQSIPVLLIDTNIQNVKSAHNEGLPAYAGSILADEFMDNDKMHKELGHLLTLTGNDEVNTLAILNYQELFRNNRYQLALHDGQLSRGLQGHIAFGHEATYSYIEKLFLSGAIVEAMELNGVNAADLKMNYDILLPMFLIDFQGRLKICTPGNLSLTGFKTLIFLRASEQVDRY